jgi:hypothetical protein
MTESRTGSYQPDVELGDRIYKWEHKGILDSEKERAKREC